MLTRSSGFHTGRVGIAPGVREGPNFPVARLRSVPSKTLRYLPKETGERRDGEWDRTDGFLHRSKPSEMNSSLPI